MSQNESSPLAMNETHESNQPDTLESVAAFPGVRAEIDPLALDQLRSLCHYKEKMSYGAPFEMFTWQQWQAMQVRLVQNCTRFQRAVEQKQPQLAAFIVLELQEVVTEMQKEVCYWISEKP